MVPLLAALCCPPAHAVPKAFGEDLVLVAVAADGHHVLLGTLGSFEEQPRDLYERDVRSGATRAVGPEVAAALAACPSTEPCPELGRRWRADALVTYTAGAPPPWSVLAWGPTGWVIEAGDDCSESATLYRECAAPRGPDRVRVRAREGDLVVSLDHYADDMSCIGCAGLLDRREARFGAKGLDALGAVGVPTGTVVWGTEGVLVVVNGASSGAEGTSGPGLAFVLPTR